MLCSPARLNDSSRNSTPAGSCICPRTKATSWRSSADDAWEAALDAMQPREEDEEGGAPAAAAAPAAPARDPRLQGFRIGGQAETAEERGEWCGPWSTAMQLIARREAALED